MTTETVEATEQATEIIDRDKLREGLRDNGYPVTEGRYITDDEAAAAKEWLSRVDDSEPPEWVLRMGQTAIVRLQAELLQHRVTVPHQVLATLPEDRAEQLAAWLADATADMPPWLVEYRDDNPLVPAQHRRVVPVEFGGLSIGDATARLSIKVERGILELDDAVETLCERRLQATIEIGEGHPRLFDADPVPTITSAFDTKKISVGSKHYSTGLTCALAEVDVRELARFAKQSGVIRIADVQNIPEGEKPSRNQDVADGEDRPHGHPALEATARAKRAIAKARADDPAGKESLDVLVTAKLRKKLGNRFDQLARHGDDGIGLTKHQVTSLKAACDGETIAEFEAWMNGNSWWHRSVSGIGEKRITKVTDSLMAYRMAFPVPADPEPEDEQPETDPWNDLDQLTDALLLVEIDATDEQVDGWTPEERQAAYLWCDATHRASTGESVDVPAKPECLAVLMNGGE